MSFKTITLKKSLTGHLGPVNELKFREPMYPDLMRFGDPFFWSRTSDGTLYPVESQDAIQRYIEACLVEPNDPLILTQLGLADTIRVKALVLSFFSEAQETSPDTETS